MSFGLRESRRRGRRRTWVRIWITIAVVCLLGLYGAFAYEVGMNYADTRSADLSQKVGELTQQIGQLQRTTQDAEVEAGTTGDRLKEMTARYDRDVPQGPAKDLFIQLQQRLKAGITPARLAFVITTVENARNCEKPELSRRIIVRVPSAASPLSTATGAGMSKTATAGFGDWGLSVTGSGVAGKDSSGETASWFDPTQPVTLTFIDTAGHTATVPGKLPFAHTIILGGAEHRFSMSAGPRGILNITAERCRYP